MYGLLSLASICSSLAEEAGAFKAKCHLERERAEGREREGGTPAASETTHGESEETGLSIMMLSCCACVHFPGAFASFLHATKCQMD